ncbi:MAG: hypothetical protein NT037_10720 [Hyphomicrobiales bacterium]|nr:hypothetical protein [Hyphomicrobiales bacterium]
MPPAPVSGAEFIEFAVYEGDCPAFEVLATVLGFAKMGYHRSRDVSLWRRGAIQIVVNSMTDGFAHSCQITPWRFVMCAGAEVPDAAATIECAAALLNAPHSGPVGKGEVVDILAARGLGGSLRSLADDGSQGLDAGDPLER